MKNAAQGFTTILKWLLFAVCAILGIKLFMTVAGIFAKGMTIATLAIWGAAALMGGAGLLFIGFKVLGGKKK